MTSFFEYLQNKNLEIFISNDRDFGWDGIYKGNMAQDGTYVWKVTFDNATTGERVVKTGHVNLIR